RAIRVARSSGYFSKQLEIRDLPRPCDVGDDPRRSGCRAHGRLHHVAHVHVVACLGAVAEDCHGLAGEHLSREDRHDSGLPVCAAAWNTTSGLKSAKTSRSDARSQISSRWSRASGGTLLADPVDRSSTTHTPWPSATRRSTMWEPMNPAPPVTSTRGPVPVKP